MPVLVLDGRIAGIWQSKRTGERMRIRVQPFVALPRSRRPALARAAMRIAAVVSAEAELEIGAVTTRPHL